MQRGESRRGLMQAATKFRIRTQKFDKFRKFKHLKNKNKMEFSACTQSVKMQKGSRWFGVTLPIEGGRVNDAFAST